MQALPKWPSGTLFLNLSCPEWPDTHFGRLSTPFHPRPEVGIVGVGTDGTNPHKHARGAGEEPWAITGRTPLRVTWNHGGGQPQLRQPREQVGTWPHLDVRWESWQQVGSSPVASMLRLCSFGSPLLK
jgi:hypothetical protein